MTIITQATYAQQAVSIKEAKESITASGNFNSGGTTAAHAYIASQIPLYTTCDSVLTGSTDSFKVKLTGYYSYVGFAFDLKKIAGRTDSFVVKIYGSKKPTPLGKGDYKLLTTLTMANADTYVEYDVNSGSGNTEDYYYCELSTTNAYPGSKASWKGYLRVK